MLASERGVEIARARSLATETEILKLAGFLPNGVDERKVEA